MTVKAPHRRCHMASYSQRIAVIDYCRTPFLRSGTGYADCMAWELGRFALKGLMGKSGVDPAWIDHIIMGTVASDIATTNVAREIGLGAGLPDTIPAHTCTVACISSNMAVTTACDMLAAGNADTVIAGGVESFSDPDIKVSRAYRRFIMDLTMFKRPKSLRGKLALLRKMRLRDFVTPERPAIGEYSTGMTMGENAERLAKRLGISKEDQDRFAVMSHARACEAIKSGYFKNEIVPVVVPGGTAVCADNGPRDDATYERVSKLTGAFDKKFGTVTAANSSFLTDGASAVLLMKEAKAKALGLKPKGYIRSYAYTGQDLYDELLLGPVFALPKALARAKLSFRDIGVFEIHEAFAVQVLAVMRCIESRSFCVERLGMKDRLGKVRVERLNAHGGSLSIGHPFGATGGRLIAACCHSLQDRGERYGVIAGCAAGAVGNAIVIENAG